MKKLTLSLSVLSLASVLAAPRGQAEGPMEVPEGIICESVGGGANLSASSPFWDAFNTTDSGGKECEAALLEQGRGGWVEGVLDFTPRGLRVTFSLTRLDVEMQVGDAFQLFRLETQEGPYLIKLRLKRIASGAYRIDLQWQSDDTSASFTPAGSVDSQRQVVTVEWVRSSGVPAGQPNADGSVRLLTGSWGEAQQLVYEQTGLLTTGRPYLLQLGAIEGIDPGTSGTLGFTPRELTVVF